LGLWKELTEGAGRRGEGAKIGIVIGPCTATTVSLSLVDGGRQVGGLHGGEAVINAQAVQSTFDELCKSRSKWPYRRW
jgi:hypothetical protein